MEVSGQPHDLAALPLGERTPGTYWIEDWMGPRASLDMVANKKIPSPAGNQNPSP
jgi:hypothetical protein